jgi:peptidoglycan hydrolase-like protein with peptidoglycan-binding domain
MQTKTRELKRQQEVLKTLGHYRGQPDGIWGPRCIEAMREFEAKRTFSPAYPTNGLPFSVHNPFPAGIFLDPEDRNLITCKELQAQAVTPLPDAKLTPDLDADQVAAKDVEKETVVTPSHETKPNVQLRHNKGDKRHAHTKR